MWGRRIWPEDFWTENPAFSRSKTRFWGFFLVFCVIYVSSGLPSARSKHPNWKQIFAYPPQVWSPILAQGFPDRKAYVLTTKILFFGFFHWLLGASCGIWRGTLPGRGQSYSVSGPPLDLFMDLTSDEIYSFSSLSENFLPIKF